MVNKPVYDFLKRCFDFFGSLFLILLLSPLFIVITLLVILTSKGGPFYRDERLGKNKKGFKVIKFRSMKSDHRPIEETLSEEDYKLYLKSYKLENDPRVTKFGKILRKTSLDELPQLFNILLGQMSFIGPRPIKEKEYRLLWHNTDDIFFVKPGLTGYWGANGRSNTDYEERIKLEVYYVHNRSILLDIKIFFKTIGVVITRKGAI